VRRRRMRTVSRGRRTSDSIRSPCRDRHREASPQGPVGLAESERHAIPRRFSGNEPQVRHPRRTGGFNQSGGDSVGESRDCASTLLHRKAERSGACIALPEGEEENAQVRVRLDRHSPDRTPSVKEPDSVAKERALLQHASIFAPSGWVSPEPEWAVERKSGERAPTPCRAGLPGLLPLASFPPREGLDQDKGLWGPISVGRPPPGLGGTEVMNRSVDVVPVARACLPRRST